MNRLFSYLALVLGPVVALPLVASGDSISTVYVSIGPVPGFSPSYSGYTTNAQAGVQNGGATTGSAGPTQFSTVTSTTWASLNADTQFNNWNSVANPAAPYNNEYGNLVFYSVILKAAPGVNGIALDNISYVESSTDPYNYFAYSCSFGGTGCGDANYSSDAVGILANGTAVASGTSGTTDVNEIIITGVGLTLDVTSQYSGTPQQQLNQAVSDENSQLGKDTITTCFSDSSDGLSNCGSLSVSPTSTAAVPEPASFAMIGLAFALGLPTYRRLRTQRNRVG